MNTLKSLWFWLRMSIKLCATAIVKPGKWCRIQVTIPETCKKCHRNVWVEYTAGHTAKGLLFTKNVILHRCNGFPPIGEPFDKELRKEQP